MYSLEYCKYKTCMLLLEHLHTNSYILHNRVKAPDQHSGAFAFISVICYTKGASLIKPPLGTTVPGPSSSEGLLFMFLFICGTLKICIERSV